MSKLVTRSSYPKDATTLFIEAAQKFMQPTPVKGQPPLWFIKRLQKKYPMPKMGYPHLMILEETLKKYGLGKSWLDHSGMTTTEAGEKCFVVEPYVNDLRQQLTEFETLCESLGLETFSSSNSWHYPGRTIRFGVFPPKE